MRALILAALSLLVLASACFVSSPDLTGLACDPTHSCVEGFVCAAGKCVAGAAAADGGGTGLDATTPPDAGCSTRCVGNVHHQCVAGVTEVILDCKLSSQECDPAEGCFTPCTGESDCETGSVCDPSSGRCVVSPTCTGLDDCQQGGCESGACIVPPDSLSTVMLPDGGVDSVSVGCGLTGEGFDGGVRTVGLRGYVVTANGAPTDTTIGASIEVYRAREFEQSETPVALTTTVAYDAGIPPGGSTPVSGYSLTGLPAGEELVVSVSFAGGLPTHQYLTLATDGAKPLDWHLYSSSQELFVKLAQSAGLELDAERAVLVGQVSDCRGLRVSQATAALDTPSQVFYSDPAFFVVDPQAKATSATGRFFAFNLPAIRATLVAGFELTTKDAYLARPVRLRKGAVTLVSLRPPLR